MGCGESKPEVATENTILSCRYDPDSKTSKDIETIPEVVTEDNTTNSSVQQQHEAENEDSKALSGAAVAADVDKIDESTALKEKDDEKMIDDLTAAGKESEKEEEVVKVVGEIENLTIKEEKSEKTVEATISNPNSDQKNQQADNQEELHKADT